jgi:uncharacterized membrane protein YqjE
MPTGSPPESTGIAGSLRALADSLIGGLQHRLGLFALELHEEKHRLVQTFIWISAIVFTSVMTLAFASITLVYCLWSSARLYALGGLTFAYATALFWLVIAFRRRIAREPKPFTGTLDELMRDRSCIRPPN